MRSVMFTIILQFVNVLRHFKETLLYPVITRLVCVYLFVNVFTVTVFGFLIKSFCIFYTEPSISDPCTPNPCGPNSICRAEGIVAHCSCRPPMFEDPPSCRPECRVDSECPPNRACRNNRCRDPCPGSCGASAICHIRSHSPICACPANYVGDPFIHCLPGILLMLNFSLCHVVLNYS